MENRLYLYNLGIKTFGGFATLGGVIQALQLFTQPDLDIKSILLSFPAWVVYVICMPDYYFCYVEGTVQIDESKGGSIEC